MKRFEDSLWLRVVFCDVPIALMFLALVLLALSARAQTPASPSVGSGAHPITVGYRTHGPAVLNDLTATPGDVRADATTAQLCDPNFHTGTIRNVPDSLKHKACAQYGLTGDACSGQHVEIDHLISLELGGSNDLKNLWPQPYAPRPAAKEKDVVENWLHAQVCHGKMSLLAAQNAIALDWYAVYLQVPKANGGGGQ